MGKITFELKSLKSGKIEILLTKINLLEKDFKSVTEKYNICTQENISVKKKYASQENSTKKKYELQLEKISKDWQIKIEEITYTLKKTETEKIRILTEKETEIIEIRESNKEHI